MSSGEPIKNVALISDTHAYLSRELLAALEGANLIAHAGDICSRQHYEQLQTIAPVKLCLGNCDWQQDYPASVKRLVRFEYEGLRWQLCHHYEKLEPASADICVCGHTHRPFIETDASGCVIVNPGSPTRPRSQMGPTCAKAQVCSGKIVSLEIVEL